MTTALKRRRGTDTNHNTFTGLEGEITVNTTNNSLHVHDGSTAGGHETLITDFSNADTVSTSLNLAGTSRLKVNTDDLEMYASSANGIIEGKESIITKVNGTTISTASASGLNVINLSATNLDVSNELILSQQGTDYAKFSTLSDDMIVNMEATAGRAYFKGHTHYFDTGSSSTRTNKLEIGPTATISRDNKNIFRRTIGTVNNISQEMVEVNNSSTTTYGWVMKFTSAHQYYSPVVGVIGYAGASSNGYIYMGNGRTSSGQSYLKFGSNEIIPANYLGAQNDNTIALGSANARFDDAYVTNDVTTGSDRNLKQDIEELSEAEQRVAVACKSLIRKYRWRDAFEQKGEEARIHVGIIAQDLEAAFTAEGLDPARYGMFCSDTYWWKEVVVPEQEKETVDENGITHTETIPETTTREVYDTESDAPDGATEVTTRSVRYCELLAFIISAM